MSRNCIAQTSDDEQAYRDPQTVEAVENPRKALPRRGSSRTLLRRCLSFPFWMVREVPKLWARVSVILTLRVWFRPADIWNFRFVAVCVADPSTFRLVDYFRLDDGANGEDRFMHSCQPACERDPELDTIAISTSFPDRRGRIALSTTVSCAAYRVIKQRFLYGKALGL